MTKTSAAKTNPMRYIQRVDKRIHAWKVGLKRKGKEVHRYFTDSKYGEDQAKKPAIKARREGLAEVAAEFKARGLTTAKIANKKPSHEP